MNRPIIIVGAGVIGLSLGWLLAREGRRVHLFERGQAGRGATWLAAGMLAPDAEIQFEEKALYKLNRESLRRWPAFAAKLEEESSIDVDYRDEGTLLVADDRDSAEELRRRYEFQREEGLDVSWLSSAEAREIEPFLAPRLAAAVYAPSDHQVDNRLLVEALIRAFQKRGGTLHEETPVQTVVPDPDRPAVITESGDRIEGATVVLATGAWTRSVGGLEPSVQAPIRPVKGQMIELRMELPVDLQHVVRGPDAYLVPKSSGRLLLGATSEEMGFDTDVTAGGMFELLESARDVVPGIDELTVTDVWAGLRPASRDHAPVLGASRASGVFFATGHYRHGILLAPITAEELVRILLHGETSSWLEPFAPARFEVSTQTVSLK